MIRNQSLALAAATAPTRVTDATFVVHTHHSARRVCTTLLLIATLTITGFITACGGSSVSVPKPLMNALSTMQEAGGYSFTASIDTGTSTVTTTGDFQAPNRISQTVTRTGSTPVSMVLDGADVYVRDSSTGTWSKKTSATESSVDLRSTFAALGSPTSMSTHGNTYTFRLSESATRQLAGSDTTGTAQVTATVGSIGLSQLEYTVNANGQPLTVTIDYRNVGTSPKVTTPV